MAVTYVDAKSAGGGASAAVSAPSGIADGDILVAFVMNSHATGYAAITKPSGFTSIITNQVTNGSNLWRNFEMAWKRASSESGNYTFSSTGTAAILAGILVLRGCLSSSDPVDVSSDGNYATVNTICRADSMTTTVTGAQVWCGFVNYATSGLAKPSAFTLGTHLDYNTNWGLTMGYRIDSGTDVWGSTGDQDGTCDGNNGGKRAMMASLAAESDAATYSGRGIARGIGRGIMRCLPKLDPWIREKSGLLVPEPIGG